MDRDQGTTNEPARRPSLIGRIWRNRLFRFGVPVLVLLVVGAVIALGELGKVPQERADEYAAAAAPAMAEVNASMNRAYLSLDAYVAENLVPKSEFKGVDDPDEFKRRLLPVHDDAIEAVGDGRDRIDNARRQIKKARPVLADVPDDAPLADNAPIERVDNVAQDSAALLDEYERYLRSYSRLLDYEIEQQKLSRRQLVMLAADDIEASGSDTIEQAQAKLSTLKDQLGKIRAGYLKLDPHPDSEKRHETFERLMTAHVDYIEDVQDGIDALDLAALDAADAQYNDAIESLGDKVTDQFFAFAAGSSLRRDSEKLTDRANGVEKRITGLSEAELEEPKRWFRLPPPDQPKSGGGAGGSDNQLS